MSDGLITEPHLEDPDEFYAALIELHAGLDAEASALVNARLVLLLANHVGRASVLRQAIAAAGMTEESKSPVRG